MAKYRIISIDGGGIRGIIPATILLRLNTDPILNGFLNKADLIAGTSTGGLLALGIANEMDPSVMQKVYIDDGEKIFDDSWLDDVKDLGKLIGADYNIKNLEEVLKRIFGNIKLSSLRKKVLVTAFDLDYESNDINKRCWKPKIFHNFEGEDSDGEMLAYKVGLYTSAAPTFFPSVDGYIDGGVFASNPSMCALSQSQDIRCISSPPKLDEIVLLSLGTGISMNYIEGDSLDWGEVQWVKPLISLMMDGVNGIADYQCNQILKDNYHRLSPIFPTNVKIDMDDVKKISYMKNFADRLDLTPIKNWIVNKWN
ncbi:MAG: patatin-like phospholipase family protein [Melioribacteraceae bacterium]